MSKTRSPSYPSISLKEAVERAVLIYNADYQNPIPRAVAAGHMGYQSLNGKSLGVLSALLKFGLLEGRGDDTRVSDLTVTIAAYPTGTRERYEAVKSAASRPELFAELDDRFKGGMASDQAIRSYLITQKFIPAAADAAIRAYRETKQFVSSQASGYTPADEAEGAQTMPSIELERQPQAGHPPVMVQPQPLPPAHGKTSVVIGDDLITISASITNQSEMQKLIDKLIAVKALLPDHAKPPIN